MREDMKYLGIFAVLLSAMAGAREFSRNKKKHACESRDFLAFISHLRVQVGCFLRTPCELVENFSSEALKACGFLDSLAEGTDFLLAFELASPHLSISREESEILRTLFSSLGEGYLESGIKIIDASYARLEPLYREISGECQKSARLASALSVTGALGFLILVI